MTPQTRLNWWGRVLPYKGSVEATCKHRAAGFFAALLVPLLALAMLPAVAFAQVIKPPAGGWGYVRADNLAAASYEPDMTIANNPAHGAINITHTDIGRYTVTFQNYGGQGYAGGNVQVTAYGGTDEYCKVDNWDSGGTDFLVNVRCFTAAGSPVNTRFAAQAIWPTFGETTGFAWADNPYADSYTPNPTYAYNSAGGPIKITRRGEGEYTISFANMVVSGHPHGDVQVTAYGSYNAHCKMSHQRQGGSDTGYGVEVSIKCYTAAGDPVNTRYSVRVTFASSWLAQGYTYPTSQIEATNGVTEALEGYNFTDGTVMGTRVAAGTYTIRFAQLGGHGFGGGNVMVTAAKPATANKCKVDSWDSSGSDFIVAIRCIDVTGATSDTPFNVQVIAPMYGASPLCRELCIELMDKCDAQYGPPDTGDLSALIKCWTIAAYDCQRATC